MNKRNFGFVLLPIVLAVGVVGGIFIEKYAGMNRLSPEEEKIRTVLGLIDSQYVDKIDVDSLLDQTIPGLLSSLDPHSVYIPASELAMTNDDLESSFGGVGVMFQVINDSVNIIEVVANGPAEKVGLQNGDIILSADGKKLSGASISSEDVFSTLRGKEGSKVKVTVKRASSRKPIDYEITRGIIPSNSVDSKYMISGGVGYLKVSKFARNTYNEFIQALNELSSQGAKKFVVDLRGNSGGFMDQAIYMANEFLPAGRMIVYTKGRTPENETMAVSDGSGHYQDAEVVVLTNEYSASASEIFAGAMQDNDRGLVIGRRTFGKGLVQNQFSLPDSSAIRLTVARYYTPSGRSIQKEYKRGKDGKYEFDIVDRYNHGEFYSQDSIKLDKNKRFKTVGGRIVYGGGGIMPDIFVPEDTTGYTSYYIEALNRGLIYKFAHEKAPVYKKMMGSEKSITAMERVLPRENMLLTNFVDYAAAHGLPARWYYVNISRNLLINQLKAAFARDLVGYGAYIEILNRKDPAVSKALSPGIRLK
ncbi:MAG: S41 family peptidase [Candidatus Amulumruptor caecigallinarius]|nr:S41 family peptidase [Candidatus Amulumruptor caecigallinarius]